MPACTSTSRQAKALLLALLLVPVLGGARMASAADGPPAPPEAGAPPSKDKTQQSEEEDFSHSPFTQYGEFNEEENEEEELRFLQYGRFFGVSLGLGIETLDGGRAQLWQGGFPMIDFKVHYWFDFNLALDLGFFTASHYFDTGVPALGGKTEVSIFHVGLDLKYYFDIKDMSAPISFANPYVIIGAGQFSKTETPDNPTNQTSFNTFGASLGLGLEFAIRPKKSYFEIEGKAHFVTFPDDNTTKYESIGIANGLSGRLYTFSGSFLFTW